MKANVQKIWRQHFVIEESMLEVECPSVTLGTVLKASGHVDRFTDLMVKDAKTEECFRGPFVGRSIGGVDRGSSDEEG